jgi:hypothetical protein
MPSEDGAAPAAAAAAVPPPEIHLDGRLWQSRADFFAAFFPAVQAPDWHGHNLDALNDSVCNGGINGLDNYTLVIRTCGRTVAQRSHERLHGHRQTDL